MSRAIVWPVRVACFVLVGVLTFIVQPPGATAVAAQFTGYAIVGLGMLTWALIDTTPAAERYRARGLPVVLGVIAVAAGFASTAGSGENSCAVLLASVATAAAGFAVDLRASWIVTIASVLAIDGNWLIYRDGSTQLSNFLLQPLVPLSGLLIGRIIRGRLVQAEQSATLLAQTQQLLAEQGRADVLGERARIAREIHDVLAHSLGALSIQIQTARVVLADHQDIGRAAEILETAQRMASDGLAETRRAVHALRTDSRPLAEELGRVTGIYGEHYDVKVTFGIGGDPRPVPPDASIALLRTAQEALVNAAKHAAGQHVAVQLDYGEAGLRLAVVNNLANGHPAASAGPAGPAGLGSSTGGYGLTGMQERLRLLNGTLVAGARAGRWTVTAELPLPSAPQLADGHLSNGHPQDETP